jgi:AraC-like DNA-binding protein
MLKDSATVRVSALRNFAEVVRNLGGDPAALLVESGIAPRLLDDRNGFIPYVTLAELLERAAAHTRCPDFGMRLAAVQEGTKVMGPLEVAMRNSPTLGAAFRYCTDHVHAYSTALQVGFEKLPDDCRVFMHFDITLPGLTNQRQAMEHAFLLTQHATQAISAGQARAREIWFTHEPLASLSTYRNHFKTTVRFGQVMNGLFFEEQDFEVPVPDADPQLHEIATSFIDDRFPTAALSVSARVRSIIGRLLVEGNCTHERVAAVLGLHPRTLQRRLREERESFESIKDNVRRDVALRYLRQPNVSLVRVTEILGYSETSVLSRSCHRWFSASPRQLRNELTR